MLRKPESAKKLTGVILKLNLLALVIASLLWFFLEIPLLEQLPGVYRTIFHKTLYPVEKHPARGVPYVHYPETGKQYNPLFIANQICLDAKTPENAGSKQRFLICSDWLYQHAVISNDKALFPYEFDYKAYKLKKPWYSALAQAKIMNALFCRYELEHDKYWLELSGKSLKSLVPNDSLGISHGLKPDGIWFQEYPGQPRSFVLNGMMETLLELMKYHQTTSDSLALHLFERGYLALLDKLPEFDSFGGSRYDLLGNITSMSYHRMHIRQLKELSALRQHPVLQRYIRRWTIYCFIPAPIQLIFNFKLRRFLAFSFIWLCISAIELILLMIIKTKST